MPSGRIQFEDFTLDCNRYELLRAGQSIKLEKLPMELLILLVERDGHLVTRQEIIERLWGQDVFLDTEHGINTAVFKLRTILGDNADKSRFIQTVTGKGYRFVALKSVTSAERDTAGNQQAPAADSSSSIAIATAEQTADSAPRELVAQPTPRSRWKLWAVVSCVIVAALGIVLWILHLRTLRSRANDQAIGSRIHSLAVLPLQNLSGDSGQEYFADGMTDELITMLARNTGLRVISRTSAMQFKNARLPLPEVARQLGVDGILEGSVGRSGDRVHVNVQLVYAPTDTHVWAESYDRDLGDLGDLESQLAVTIAEQVGLTVSKTSSPPKQIKPEAHDAYLWGRYYWFGYSAKSGQYFQKAIDLQPDYAAAWSGLADSLTVQAVEGMVLPAQVIGRAEFAARKALELDPQLGDAHNSMAATQLFGDWDYAAADRESARAIELDPRNSESHHLRSYVLEALNRKDEALQEQKLANDLDPRLRPMAMAYLLIRLHRFDDAIQDARARLEAEPDEPSVLDALAQAYRLKGMDQQSAEEWAKCLAAMGMESDADASRRAFAGGGMNGLLEWQLAQDIKSASKSYSSPLDLAKDYARLKRKEDTLRCLEEAYQQRVASMIFLRGEPDFDFVHSEPRYQAIVKAMRLPTN